MDAAMDAAAVAGAATALCALVACPMAMLWGLVWLVVKVAERQTRQERLAAERYRRAARAKALARGVKR